MIVPMKKVSLIIRENKKDETLKKLRKLGIVHIEIAEGAGERLASLQEQIALLESAIFTIGKRKNVEQKDASTAEALSVATRIQTLDAEKKQCVAERIALSSELDRLKSWGAELLNWIKEGEYERVMNGDGGKIGFFGK